MQTQSLSTQGLKDLLQKVISQKGQAQAPLKPASTHVPAETPLQTPAIKDEDPVFDYVEIAPAAVDITLDLAVQEAYAVQEPASEITFEAIHEAEPIAESIKQNEPQAEVVEPKMVLATSADSTERPRKIAKAEAKLEEKEKQITALKKSVKELSAANLANEKALEKSKVLIAELSVRSKEYETLQPQLQNQRSEIAELEKTVSTLTKSLKEAEREIQNTEDSLTLKIQATSLDGQETKQRLLRLIADKKELEDRVTALSCEKATLAARLQSLTQKGTKLEEQEISLTEQIKEVTCTLETTTQELATTQNELQQSQAQLKNLEDENSEYRLSLEGLTDQLNKQTRLAEELERKNSMLSEELENMQRSHSQELAVTKACLQEQSHVLEEEQTKFRLLAQENVFTQKRAEEQENHLRLLEQHLARRVKECALLSKQLEDLMDRTSDLQTSLTANQQKYTSLEEAFEASKKIENALRLELDSQANALQDQLLQKDNELTQYSEALQQKDNELAALRRMQHQFSELENLVKRSAEIFTATDEPAVEQLNPYISQAIPTQKDIFSFPAASKPLPKSLFE